MCGIAGYCNMCGSAARLETIHTMTATLRHRGPDGMNIFVEGPVALGHTRLAILDLTAAGRQPMSTPDNMHTIVFNGEIYNYLELRHQLVNLGYSFNSRTDTEVVLNAYREWGADCVSRFNGMFAFCIFDSRKRELFFSRDRYGIKPLYYTFCGDVFLFASEAKAFMRHPAFRASLDLEALTEYLTFQNILSDKTFFEGVRIVKPGYFGKISLDGKRALALTQYWDFHFHEAADAPALEEAQEELARLFQQAVKRSLASDVEIGTYLSGGIDSGSITAIAARELPYLKSFTCGFDLHSASGMEIAFDEREKSEFLSYLFKTEHYESVLKSGDMERVMPLLSWHMEEPRLGQSYPNFFAAKLASRFVKVVLSGCGGDELFAGYPWRYYRVMDCRSFEGYIDRYYAYWQRLIPNTRLHPLLAPIAQQVGHVWTRNIFCDVFGSQSHAPESFAQSVNLSLYFEAKTFLSSLLLVEDKLSMAHGLEVRLPFLDNDLVDFACGLPVAYKLHNVEENIRINENLPGKMQQYYCRHDDGKHILRQVMRRFAPEAVSSAPKQGFSGPDASWFRGESIDYLRKTIMTPSARIWEYLDYTVASKLVDEHLTGQENRRLFIWSLLSVEWWLRKYL